MQLTSVILTLDQTQSDTDRDARKQELLCQLSHEGLSESVSFDGVGLMNLLLILHQNSDQCSKERTLYGRFCLKNKNKQIKTKIDKRKPLKLGCNKSDNHRQIFFSKLA